MLETIGLCFRYSNERLLSFPDIILKKSESLLILGNSGVGKTTLLHLLGLILSPKSGQLKINNEETTGLKPSKLTQFRAKNIGIVFQRPHFVSSLTVQENITLSCLLADKKLDSSYFQNLTEALGIAELLGKGINKLSLGELQRVSIARALVSKPSLILADEPTSSLDDASCAKVIELLKEQTNNIEANLIIVTHDQRLKTEFPKQIQLEK
jgi:lipoprotein-releasing system ATP-binding protein